MEATHRKIETNELIKLCSVGIILFLFRQHHCKMIMGRTLYQYYKEHAAMNLLMQCLANV